MSYALTKGEWALLAAVGCVFPFFPTGSLAVILTFATFSHTWSGKPRLALTPLYVCWVIIVQGLFVDMFLSTPPEDGYDPALAPAPAWGVLPSALLPLVMFPLCALAAGLAILLPLPVLPAPMHSIPGVTVVMLDELVAASEADDAVQCRLRLYYPSDVDPRWLDMAKYMPDHKQTSRAIARFAKLPGRVMDHLVHTMHSIYEWEEEVPIAQLGANQSKQAQRLPCVVFSHGLGGVPALYTSIIQELASQGYLVLAIEHADGSGAFTSLQDGPLEYQPLTKAETKDMGLQFARRNTQLKRRVAEVRLALDTLELFTTTNPNNSSEMHKLLHNRVDMRRVAVMGHSFGGATALASAAQDPRIAAVVALDTWMFPIDADSVSKGISVPVFSLFGDGFTKWKTNTTSARSLLLAPDTAPFVPLFSDGDSGKAIPVTPPRHKHNVVYTLHSAEHQTFNDLPFFAPRVLRFMKQLGSLPPATTSRIISTLALSFLHGNFSKKQYHLPASIVKSMQALAEGYTANHCTQWSPDDE